MDTQATTKQTVVLDVRQQSPAARLIAAITQHRIDSLGLVPLVCRTGVPAKQIIWARHIRDEVMLSLLPDIAEGTKAEQALVVACNLHPEAKWWLEHSNTAKNLIAQAAARLQQMAAGRKEDRESEGE